MSHSPKVGARERILEAAYDLFSRRGIRDVTVDEIISRSKVAIATFYRHFSSKDQLAEAFLSRREEVWTSEMIVAEAAKRADEPRAQLLAIFDIFEEWFAREDFEGDSFVKVLLEMGPDHPLGRASIAHLNTVRRSIRSIAEKAGVSDLDNFAHSMQILMKGCIITAAMGDKDAGCRAKAMAERLLADHTRGTGVGVPDEADTRPNATVSQIDGSSVNRQGVITDRAPQSDPDSESSGRKASSAHTG